MTKRGFVLFHDYAEQFCSLSDASAGKLIKAIFEYEISGSCQKLPQRADMAFMFIKNSLDENRKKYEAVCEKRREARKKGGIASVLSKSSKCNQMQPDTDTETETDTDTVTDTDTKQKSRRSRISERLRKAGFDFDFEDIYERP